MKLKNHITRKEIADMLGVSVDTVERRETEWGLTKAKSAASRRPILFLKSSTIRILTARGLLAD